MRHISLRFLLLSYICIMSACGGGGSNSSPGIASSTSTPSTTVSATTTSTAAIATSTSISVTTSTSSSTSSTASTATTTTNSSNLTSTTALVSTTSTSTTTSSTSTTTAASLRATPEAGFRITKASNPFATVDSTGIAYLGYMDRGANGQMKFQSSGDGINFSNPVVLTYNNRAVDSRKTLMPDGKTWRLYDWDNNSKTLVSRSSTDGNVFNLDSGVRYTPASTDNNTFGVFDTYVAKDNSVILIYLGDLQGKNNLRMARSTDNGLTFAFYKGNVLGDDNAGGGPNSFVDNKTLLLPDGRRRMMTMRKNEIYSFISTDGITYAQENVVSMKPSDFASLGISIYSLNDPVLVRTSNGKYRVYVAAATSTSAETPGSTDWAIVSALWPD